MMPTDVIFSYIDPFSGSILLQLAIAGVVGAIGFFRKSMDSMVPRGDLVSTGYCLVWGSC